MLEAAGCNDPDRVLQSFQRILMEGARCIGMSFKILAWAA